MPILNEIQSIVVPAENANLTAHTYTEVYGGSTGCSIVINGQNISMGASSSIFVRVRTVSGGVGCALLGENKNLYTGSETL
jgi:hypothetical protein